MISVQSLGIVLLIALVVFGPSKLPEIGKALGKGIREFKTNATEDDTKPAAQQQINVTEQPKELPPKTDETVKK